MAMTTADEPFADGGRDRLHGLVTVQPPFAIGALASLAPCSRALRTLHGVNR
jgi:hypothetical protein